MLHSHDSFLEIVDFEDELFLQRLQRQVLRLPSQQRLLLLQNRLIHLD